MISENQVKKYCNEDISNIENYDKAVADTTQVWHLHHRMETHRRNGTKRKFILSAKLLKEWDVYYNRPASELIFLTHSEHSALPRSEETKRNIGEAHKGQNKGKQYEAEKKLRAKLWNNMQASVYQSDHKGTRKAPFYDDVKRWYQAYQDLETIKNDIIDKYLGEI